MVQFIFDTATTLNGFLADERHSLDWLFAVEGGDAPSDDLYPSGARVLVEGSHTYEWVLRHERLLENPARWGELYGDKITFVFTSRHLPVPEGADVRLLRGSVADALPEIRAAAGAAAGSGAAAGAGASGGAGASEPQVWIVGGGDLAGQFYDAGALDRIAVSVAPATLPGGAPLLPRRIDPAHLRLERARAVGQFARLEYAVIRNEAPR